MRQRRICDVWGCSCPPRKTFLDFPESVRQSIYLYAGVCLHRHIVLKPLEYVNNRHYFLYEVDVETIFNLLQTCKAIHDEVKSIIFAENQIVVPHDNFTNALELLRDLPPDICSKLTRLCVHLLASPHMLPTRGPPGVGVFWQVVVKRLLSHSPPGTLNLHLVCRTTDMTFLSSVLQPFVDFPGVLKDFDLDLGDGNDINTISQAPVLGLRLPILFKDRTVATKSFRYSDLPAEIQEQVLINTDLVIPFREVYWNAHHGYHIKYDLWDDETPPCQRFLHAGCSFRFCSLSDCWHNNRIPCCTHRFGYAPCLRCWQSPRSLMFVNRAMYADAIRILWTYNRIIIYPWASQRSLCQTFPLQDATRFLKQHQWPHILHRLRTLELALDDVPFESLLSEPKVNAWCSAVAHFRDYANVEKLTIIIHITRSYILSRYFNCGGRRLVGILKRRALSDKELKVALGGHARYLEPLKSLRLMKRFFVHLETLRASRVGRYVRNEEELESIRLNLRSIETWLEKFVMGKEYYSGALGKGEQQPSQWLEIFPHGRD